MEKQIRDFFNNHILPLNKQAAATEMHYLDASVDKSCSSYFLEPTHPAYLFLNTIPFDSPEKLERYLGEFWKDEPGIQKLVPDLVRLAFELKEEHKEQSAELSPFIYAMF